MIKGDSTCRLLEQTRKNEGNFCRRLFRTGDKYHQDEGATFGMPDADDL
jgi:hypothetical protein